MKKIFLIFLTILMLGGFLTGAHFIASDVYNAVSIEQPGDVSNEEDKAPETPDEPVDEDQETPDVAWADLLGAVVDGYSPDLKPENYDGFMSNSMSFVILPDQVLLTPSFYDESEDKLVYYALPNNEFCISLQILTFEDGVLTADAVAVFGYNITFSLNEDGKMLVFGEEVPLFCSNIEAYQPAS